tara:strand:- start:89 stop:1102 length:1014 start_codon:yes stop_codon:yes gene_type:complete
MKFETAEELINRRVALREQGWDYRVNRFRSEDVKDFLWKQYDTQLSNWDFVFAAEYFRLLQKQTRLINKMYAELGVTEGVQGVVNSAIDREARETWYDALTPLYMSMAWDFAYTTVETLLPEALKEVSDNNSTFSPAEQEAIRRASRRKPRKEVIENGFHPTRGRGRQIPVNRTKYNRSARRFVENRLDTYVPEMSKTMKDNLNRALRRGYDEATRLGLTGKARDEFIKKEISKSLGKKNLSRALTIARTEGLVLANFSQQQTVEELEIITTKEWITQRDGKVRDAHRFLDGDEVQQDEMFVTQGYQMKYPGDSSNGAPAGLVINCRCMLVYHEKKM